MSEGHWFRLIRTCALSQNDFAIKELPEMYNNLEDSSYKAKIIIPAFNIKTEKQGIFSTLITTRNKLFGHGMSLSADEKEILKPKIIALFRAVIYIYKPLWEYDLAYSFGGKHSNKMFNLKGTENFDEINLTPNEESTLTFLAQDGEFKLKLFPIIFADKPASKRNITILDKESEIFILNNIARKKIPSFMGLSGENKKRQDLSESFDSLMSEKNVWDKRQDIELDNIFNYLIEKAQEKIDDSELNNLYLKEQFVERRSVTKHIDDYIKDDTKRALFISGVSGCGKTSSIIHLTDKLSKSKESVLFLRAIEFDKDIVRPKSLERLILAELGYKGTMDEVLERAKKHGNGKFTIIIDGCQFTNLTKKVMKNKPQLFTYQLPVFSSSSSSFILIA